MRKWMIPFAVAAAAFAAPAWAQAAQEEQQQALAVSPVPADGRLWAFIFKFNAATAPSGGPDVVRPCPFGGKPTDYPGAFSQAFAAATSDSPELKAGTGLAGTGSGDPLGAAFGRIYDGPYNFVVWNDQFYGHPAITGCSDSCSSPWGHSKGVLAWDDNGRGLVIQVTTPSWPAAGGKANPRPDYGNTLGCVVRPNNLKFSQHFFALQLSPEDVGHVLDALANASVVTDPSNPVLVRSGGPEPLRQKLALLGHKSKSTEIVDVTLSSGVRLISKPSALNVPPWQLVSARLGGVPLRAATWWANPAIPSTSATTKIGCWNPALGTPGPVQIATSGKWQGKTIDLRGGSGNHGKIGVSLTGRYTIFGDMNQQGALSGRCASSQNGRGGMFFILEDQALHDSVAALIDGNSAPVAPD